MRFALFVLFNIFSLVSFGQSNNRKAQKLFDEALKNIRIADYNTAISQLNEAVEQDSNFQAAHFELGNLYRKQNFFLKAAENFNRGLTVAPLANPNFYFTIGQTNLLAGEYNQAKDKLNLFLAKGQNISPLVLAQTNKYLKDCEFALQALETPLAYKPINLGSQINSKHKDYFPALTADGNTLIFTRNVDGNEDFYFANKLNEQWSTAQALSKNINTSQYNEGAQSISPDGRYLFFTGCNRPDGYGRCDIYLCYRQGNNWSKPVNLGKVINTNEWESQPSISADGQTLYFLSNRPGGLGGYDIWKSTLDENSNWTNPTNLGPNINTPDDEATPFIHADGKTLYFASEGWPGMGEKDIYFSTLQQDGTFSKAKNLGYPINSCRDEFGLIVTADGKHGLLSSNLAGGFGDVDIYQFDLPDVIKPDAALFVKGVVLDKVTQKPLEGNITIINIVNQKSVYSETSDENTGNFLAIMPGNQKYAFNVLAEGYLIYSKHFDLQDSTATLPHDLKVAMEPIEKGSRVQLNNIFFDTNQFNLLPASLVELRLLTYFLKTNPKIIVEIQGHTDNVGSDKDNQILSENRAKAVFNYLISEQIPKQQLNYKGYGESKPAANNATATGRKLNRRTEFIVVAN